MIERCRRPGQADWSQSDTRSRRWRPAAWRREDGAVSLYLIVSTAAMLVFVSLLVDYARIAAFGKQSELAAQSGIRSALSAYDEELYERYGLFGAGGSDRGELFAQAVDGNWAEADDNDGFRLLRMKRESSQVNTEEVLGYHAVFTRQVLEEMKYKAPIDFTMEVASKFIPLSGAMKDASETVNALEDIRRLYEEREKHLARALELQTLSGQRAEKLQEAINKGAVIVEGYGAYENWVREDALRSANEAAAGKGDADSSEAVENRVEGSLHESEIADYRSRSLNAVTAIASGIAGETARQEEELARAVSEISAASQLNDEISAAVEQAGEVDEEGGFGRLSGTNVAGQASSNMNPDDLAGLSEARDSAATLVMEATWFDAYGEEISAQLEGFRRIDAAARQFVATVRQAVASTGYGFQLQASKGELDRAFQAYSRLYGDPGTVIRARQEERQGRQANDAERKANEAAAESKWGEMRALLGGIGRAGDAGGGSSQDERREAFREAQRLAEANLAFNQAAQTHLPDDSDSGESQPKQAGEATVSAMSSMGAAFGGMADLLQGIRDPLYVNEYIVHRFRSFEPRQLRELMVGKGGGTETGTASSSLASALTLENQEVEYILYGLEEPGANVAAAWGEIFGARLAVRTMEGLIACRALGHPLLILSAAVLYGLEKAMNDMLTLAETGKVALSKYVPVDLTYADYLRLFLILHGQGGQKRTARVIGLIERNTGTELTSVATGLSAEMTTSVNLWFLPGLMRSFTAAGILDGHVKGGRYEKTQTIGTSYG